MPAEKYKNPPVTEVSFGLSFMQLEGLRASHLGLFWNLIRAEYPETEDQPALLRAEELGSPIANRYPLPRTWYVHRDRNLLIQLQSNRVWLNWRRLKPSDEYPHFPALMERFRQVVGRLADFVRSANVGLLLPTGFELAYVNYVPAGALWASYGDVDHFMRDVAWSPKARKLPSPEGIAWNAIFAVDGIRLTADLKAGKEPAGEQRPVYVLELRAVSIAAPATPAPILEKDFEWYQRAHTLLNDAFDDLTTPEAQRDHWQRTDTAN